MSELKLITPRRNFLIRALGFTAAGATLPIGIVAADDPAARIAHHQAELEKAWRDHYRPAPLPTYAGVRPPRPTYTSHSRPWAALSSFIICSSEDKLADWGLEGHARKCQQARG